MDPTLDLDELIQARPMSSHWLKLDYVSDVEAIFIFYNVEPLNLSMMHLPIEYYIRAIDDLRLWEIMRRSEIPFIRGKGIPLKEFIEFIVGKQIPVPSHLQGLVTSQKMDLASEEDVSDQNLKSKRLVQLQRDFARRFAVIAWKKESHKSTSANALVQTKGFKEAMKLVGADQIDPKTHAEWISDLSPRSKNGKK